MPQEKAEIKWPLTAWPRPLATGHEPVGDRPAPTMHRTASAAPFLAFSLPHR